MTYYAGRIVFGVAAVAVLCTVVTVLLMLAGAWSYVEFLGPIALGFILLTAALLYFLTPPAARMRFVDSIEALETRPLGVKLARGFGSAAAALGSLALLGIAYGSWQALTNHDGLAYIEANKPQVGATFVSAADGSGRECDVVVMAGGSRLTARLKGFCDEYAIPTAGTGLKIEEWNGKVTNLYWETGTWTTLDDPSPGFSFGVACLIGGAVAGALALLIRLLQGGLLAAMHERSRTQVDELLPPVPGEPSQG